MKHSIFCEVVSIESLKARSELIKQSVLGLDERKIAEPFPTQKQIQFARTSIEELPEHEKVIVVLHFWEGMTLSEISTFLNMPYQLVKSLKDEAIHRLRLNYLVEFSVRTTKVIEPKGVLELVS